ncbi:hypothetical protein BC936DRAFT_137075 [Jimgerdemannia flammicorona]|uniref:Uncharacterized protein n=1 Tax=Jimgerdemannia flammicorona TaxID=994334 RepID=A0A433DJ84_9FUNG|nr:hypothetical protein BC936DRAFT_137075 [Jimgerdemannia flammicorona]
MHFASSMNRVLSCGISSYLRPSGGPARFVHFRNHRHSPRPRRDQQLLAHECNTVDVFSVLTRKVIFEPNDIPMVMIFKHGKSIPASPHLPDNDFACDTNVKTKASQCAMVEHAMACAPLLALDNPAITTVLCDFLRIFYLHTAARTTQADDRKPKSATTVPLPNHRARPDVVPFS